VRSKTYRTALSPLQRTHAYLTPLLWSSVRNRPRGIVGVIDLAPIITGPTGAEALPPESNSAPLTGARGEFSQIIEAGLRTSE
jgi:hypothetical protein